MALPPAATSLISSPLVSMYLRLTATYLTGLVTAPFVALLVKPVLQSTVKTTMRVAWEVKRLAAEAAEEFQDLTNEVAADLAEEEGRTQADEPVFETRDSRLAGVI